MRKLCLPAAAALVALLALTPTVHAGGLKSFKGPLVKDQDTEVSVANAGLRLVSYRFSRQPRGARNIFKIGSGPNISFLVRNEGTLPRDFAVAVALFDKSGLLVGVGAEENSGKLDPGEEKEVKVVFRGVNQNMGSAASMQVSLEIQL